MPRVRSPIKGDLYRGSLLNFWCVRPGGSPIKVNLSIKNGKIADVKFTHNETPAVGGSALDKIKADVLKSQNINVDAISGATATSKAALSALEAAFLKAGGSKAISKKTSTAKDKAYENTTTDVVGFF